MDKPDGDGGGGDSSRGSFSGASTGGANGAVSRTDGVVTPPSGGIQASVTQAAAVALAGGDASGGITMVSDRGDGSGRAMIGRPTAQALVDDFVEDGGLGRGTADNEQALAADNLIDPVANLRKTVSETLPDYVASFRDEDVAEDYLDSLYGIYTRDSNGVLATEDVDSIPTDDGWVVGFNAAAKDVTYIHEYSHGLVVGEYSFTNKRTGSMRGGPYDVTQNYPSQSNEHGVVPFDFGGAHNDPENFMFVEQGGDTPVGLDEWRGDIIERGQILADPEKAEFEDATTPEDVIGTVTVGDLVEIEAANGLSSSCVIQEIDEHTDTTLTAHIEQVSGTNPLTPDTITVERGEDLELGDAMQNEIVATGSYPGDATSPPDDGEHPLSNADGFIEDPNTPDEKIHNLVSAANKAWARQAREIVYNITEGNGEQKDVEPYLIADGYSATNASETIAQAGEMLLSTDDYALNARSMAEQHPELTAAYLDLIEPSEDALAAIEKSDAADEWNLV